MISNNAIKMIEFKSLLTTRSNIKKVDGIKYLPQRLACDVIDVLPKRGGKRLPINLDRTQLEELNSQGKTLNEMAIALNTSISSIRNYLKKFGISNSNQDEIRAIRKYFSAETREEKAKAFAIVDKILEKIAQEKYQPNNATTIEDCLQELRLRFFQLTNRKTEGLRNTQANLFNTLRESEIEHISKSSVRKGIPPLFKSSEVDLSTEMFEDFDFADYLINYSHLNRHEKYIVDDLVNKKMTVLEIAEQSNLPTKKVRQVIRRALYLITEKRKKIAEKEFLQQRCDFAMRVVQDVEKRDQKHINGLNNSKGF